MVEVYYIEDDENIAQAVKEYLYEKNCIVSVFATITDAKKAITCLLYTSTLQAGKG